ncbi:aldehyde dehydrogenase family protein [Microbaculum marinum]|uniref:Aldehyde dehydrogenase family protein n=1 Tax=Microbaculum marinum TaxID=1764581 RepID=A0AAW9RQC2_9HYPH
MTAAAQLHPALETHRNIIAGRSVAAADGRTLDVLCPSDGAVFAAIARSGAADVDAAVAAGRAAFEGAWGRMAPHERGRLLTRLGQAILDNFDELAELESRDTGKPARQGKADITSAARYFEFYGGACDKLSGDTLPFLPDHMALTLREPHGVTGHIIPWNYPAQMYGRSVGGALAMGNAVVLKPAEEACLTPLRITGLALEVGFPAGAINIVTGTGEEAGAALSGHPGIDFISFTGSPEVGTLVQAAAARNHIGATLELGGKSPQILFADADLEAALPVVVNAIIQNGGQTCSAGSRVLIEESICEEVMKDLAQRFAGLVAGPHQDDRDVGPLISARQRDRVSGFLARAKDEGVPLLAEGTIADGAPAGGFYAAPALFGPVPRDNALACDEVFGPVLSAIPFADEADAVRVANASDYGLVAGVWTADGARQMRVARALQVGQVFVNCYGAGGGVELPFGGRKKSGHGREKGFDALYEFSTSKTVVFRHG